MIEVRTLGTAEVLAGTHRITPDSTMLFALALFLSVSAGQRVQRSRLLELFWPDASDVSRRHALRQLVYRLRRVGFPLSLDGEELLVEEAAVDSDIRRVLAARWPEEASHHEVATAVSVLPGYDPEMPELFRAWVDELRSRANSQYRRALLVQIGAARRDARWHDVDGWARRCLDVDPLNEEATLAHAEAIAMTGSKAEALKIIDAYLDELGDRGRVIGLPAKVLRRRVSENAPERPRGEAESVPLIGRAREVAQLNDALDETLSGQGAARLIVGAAGIGKSRLAQELLSIAAMRGWRTVSTRLQASDTERPLGVFVDLFGALLQCPGALGCSPSSLAQLRLLTEHELQRGEEAQRSQEGEAVQERLRVAAIDLLESIASEGPLLVLVDDLHWSDVASIRLLQHVVSRSAKMPVLWMLTARPEASYDAVRQAMSDLRVETLALAPLAQEYVDALFGSLARRDAAATGAVRTELATAITGGNPLFVLELARHVRESGKLSTLPQSLRSLIRDRAARLSPKAQHVLHTCAVLGRYSSVSRVSSVLEIGTAELLACIEELDALGIVGTSAEAEALLIHDLWREELLQRILPASRTLLHHRCGLVLEGECRVSRAPATVWAAAQHFLASGSEGRALSLLEESAQHQLNNGLPVEAANTFELAYRASTSDADKLRAVTGRVFALKRAADWTQISDLIESAVELEARSSIQGSRHSELELLHSEALWLTEQDLSRSLERSLACVFDHSAAPGHRAHAALLGAIATDNLCRFTELERIHEITSALPVALGDGRAEALSVRLIYETTLGSLDRAREVSSDLIALEREAGSVRGLVRALRFSCQAHRMLGEFDRAFTAATESLELAERHHLAGEAASAADTILSMHLENEQLSAARSWIARCEALAARVGAKYASASIAFDKALYALLLDDTDGALDCVAPYLEQRFSDPMVRQRMLLLSILSRIAISRGDLGNLRELAEPLRGALDLRRSTGTHDFHVASYAHARKALGDLDGATSYARDFVARSRRNRTTPSKELRAYLEG